MLAWIADQEIYRVGFVGERHLKSFAALLGVHERKAQPARGLVWPPDKEDEANNEAGKTGFVPVAEPIELERNTRIVNPAQTDIPFTVAFPQGSTDKTRLLLSDAKPLRVHAVAGASRIAVNYLSDRKGAVYVPDFSRDAAAQQIELSFDRPIVRPVADDLDKLVALGISVKSEIPGAHDEDAKSWGPIAFDYRVGADGWQRVDVVSDGTLALARTGVVVLRIPPGAGSPSVLRLRLDRGFFPVAPKLTKLALNVLPIVQLETVEAGMLARSNGLPDQVVSLDISNLPEPGAEVRELAIFTEEDNARVEWTPVPDFTAFGAERFPLRCRQAAQTAALRQWYQRPHSAPQCRHSPRRLSRYPRPRGQSRRQLEVAAGRQSWGVRQESRADRAAAVTRPALRSLSPGRASRRSDATRCSRMTTCGMRC